MQAIATAPYPPLAFTEAESLYAYQEWGANCGPAALAAILGRSLDEVKRHLGYFEARGYMTTSDMKAALKSLGVRHTHYAKESGLPAYGLCRVQWGGSWLRPGVHPGAAASRTHWIATALEGEGDTARRWTYDVNAGWQRHGVWQVETVRALLAEVKGSDGTFFVPDVVALERRSARG